MTRARTIRPRRFWTARLSVRIVSQACSPIWKRLAVPISIPVLLTFLVMPKRPRRVGVLMETAAKALRRPLFLRSVVCMAVPLLGVSYLSLPPADKRPRPMIPDELLGRLSSRADKNAQRAEGIEIACEIIGKLATVKGLRGFEIRSSEDDDAALEVMEKAGLRCS